MVILTDEAGIFASSGPRASMFSGKAPKTNGLSGKRLSIGLANPLAEFKLLWRYGFHGYANWN